MRAPRQPPFKRKPKHGTWEFFCGHANEVPYECPCPEGCGCQFYHCKNRLPTPGDRVEASGLNNRATRTGSVSRAGRSATAHRLPQPYVPANPPGEGRSAPSVSRKHSGRRAVPPAVGVAGAIVRACRCKRHPGYKAIRAPRVPCHPCWWMYLYYNKLWCSPEGMIR